MQNQDQLVTFAVGLAVESVARSALSESRYLMVLVLNLTVVDVVLFLLVISYLEFLLYDLGTVEANAG